MIITINKHIPDYKLLAENYDIEYHPENVNNQLSVFISEKDCLAHKLDSLDDVIGFAINLLQAKIVDSEFKFKGFMMSGDNSYSEVFFALIK